MKINNQILRNSYLCGFKVKHLWENEVSKQGIPKQIEYLNNKLAEKYIHQNEIQFQELRITDDQNLPTSKLSGFYRITYSNHEFHLKYPLVEFRTQKNNKQKSNAYFFIAKDKIAKEDIEYLKEVSHLLLHQLNIQEMTCSVIYDYDMKVRNLKIKHEDRETYVSQRIKNIIENDNIHPTRIPHCSFCELNAYCKKVLVDEDNLKLLRRISDKEVSKLKSKGIFTINQLSFTFKPRRRKRQTNSKGRYLYELKALSLKDNKTHVLNKKVLPKAENEIFIDFEGNLKHSVYLIGVVLKKDENISKHILWSDKTGDEKIFHDFFRFISKLEGDYCLFHYGSYEIKALQKINEKFSIIGKEKLSIIEEKSHNLLDYFYSDVFPPTYSNGLKEIAKYLGFEWSKRNANGIQVTYWRNDWLENQSEKTKRKIITYNIEDCLALLKIKNWLNKIFEGKEELKDVIPDTKKHLKSRSSLKYGRTNFLIKEYQDVNELAYFDYQRKKVIIRDKEFKKYYSPKKLRPKISNKTNQNIYPSTPKKCENCGSYMLKRHENRIRKITDLKITSTGIKKNFILFHGQRFRCEECGHAFTPTNYKRQSKYGYNLCIWAVNQAISYRMSYGNIKRSLFEYFQISLNHNSIVRFRSRIANRYSLLIEEFTQNLKQGNLIQGDETKINLRKESGYIWVLTNLNTVLYFYQPNREGEFIHDFLKDFKGVIVSDYYSVYESIDCPQQKCLIHLIRDINDDLFKNQLNEELQYVAQKFGEILKKIISTVDKYGLKKRHLNKHLKDVSKFYKDIKGKEFNSELGRSWQKRFTKNEGKLFTFLKHDGVPWNNNNAENAVKSFALHRREINGYYTPKGMEEFLILLSISETCKFRGINFWEFLKSKKMSLEK